MIRLSLHRQDNAPRGQVLVIGAAAMVVLLGISALVIDLGFSWMLRREAQNAADAGAVAAARYLPDEPGVGPLKTAAACFYAHQHGFFPGDSGCAGDAMHSLYVGPPSPGSEYASLAGYVEVRIRSTHDLFFGRIFGQTQATVGTSAIAANGASGVGNANANSLVALDPTTCGAGLITGNGTISITAIGGTGPGGFVSVNSICGIDPPIGAVNNQCQNQGDGGMRFEGNNAVLVTAHLYVRGTCDKSSNPWSGPTTEGAGEITDTITGLVEPNHTALPVRGGLTSCPAPGRLLSPGRGCVFEGNAGYPATLDPGVYYGGWVIRGQAKLRLNPGIYYIAGGGIQMSGNPENSLEVTGSGKALFFSTGDPTYADSCIQDADFPPPPPVSAVQYARPDGFSLSDGTWEGTYQSINTEAGNATADATFLASPTGPTVSNLYEVTLSDVDTPVATSDVVVRYRYSKSGDSSGQVTNLAVELRQGSTRIASKSHAGIPGVTTSGWQRGSFTLSATEAASITNWNDLRLRFDPSTTGGGEARGAQISWAAVEVPPGPAATVVRRCQGKIEIVGGNSFKAQATDIAPWAGLLMWQDGTLDGNGRGNNPIAKVDIGGQGSMNISGTIYAPKARVTLRGNGSSDPTARTAAVQVIAWQFAVTGNGGLDMPYDPSLLFGTPQTAKKGLVH